MPFNLDQWKETTKEKLQGWKVRMENAGMNSAYYFLAGVSLWSVAQAVHTGDWSGLAVLGATVGTSVSTNLLANIVQKAKDKSDVEVAQLLQEEVKSSPELKAEIEAMLQKLDALQEAEKALSQADKAWFAELIQRELKQLNSGIKYEASLTGSGAIAQGNGSIAAGAGGIVIAGDVSNSKIDARKIDAKTYIEKQVIESPNPEAEKTETARRAYLERMRRHCQSLPLGALGVEDGSGEEITLDQVYVDLDTSLSIKKSNLEDLRSGQKVHLSESMVTKEIPEEMQLPGTEKDITSLPLWDAIRATPRVVILGDPGAGKSTFVRKMLGLQAAVMLRQCDALPGFEPDLLPVLIVLRELAANLEVQRIEPLAAAAQKKELLAHIHQYLGNDLKRTSAEASIDMIQQALESGKVLLVLDGLDEVPQNRRRIIRQLVGALVSEYQVERLVITSRIRSYVGTAIFENIQTFTIIPFEKNKIRGFIKAWYHTQEKLGHIHEHDLQPRIQDLSMAAISDNLREISGNPMMLTSMAIIHQKEIGLPRERVRLYKLVVDVLLRRWQKYKQGEGQLAPSPELGAFLMDDLRLLNAMERLAYEAHLAGREKQGADLLRMRALEILDQREYLNDIGLAGEFLDYVDQRSGLLKGNGGDLEKPTSYGFPHRTFQEYLAGCYMVRERNPSREYFQRAAEGDYWSLAAQLGAEELYYNRRAKHTVMDLAYQLMPPQQNTEQEYRAALWSAQVAQIADLDAIKSDTETPNGGENYLASLPTRLLALFSGSLTPIERAEAGRILAQVGDPREDVTSIEKMVFCRVPAGEFIMGEKDKQSKVNLPEYFISQYPITNAQFDQFVKADGYKQEKYWQEARQNKYWSEAGFKGRYEKEARQVSIDNGFPFSLSNHPVMNVSWYEALAFTRWLNEQLHAVDQFLVFKEENRVLIQKDCQVTLPNESEWEKAARGVDGRTYPWGGEFNTNLANTSDAGIKSTSAVGCFPQGVSPYGLQDASGNVWEWMRNDYKSGKDDFQSTEYKALRGGSFSVASDYARCAFRFGDDPDLRLRNLGFRVVVVSPAILS